MKRKVVNPNPQEIKLKKLEEKIYESDVKEELITEEMLEEERAKANQKNKIK